MKKGQELNFDKNITNGMLLGNKKEWIIETSWVDLKNMLIEKEINLERSHRI